MGSTRTLTDSRRPSRLRSKTVTWFGRRESYSSKNLVGADTRSWPLMPRMKSPLRIPALCAGLSANTCSTKIAPSLSYFGVIPTHPFWLKCCVICRAQAAKSSSSSCPTAAWAGITRMRAQHATSTRLSAVRYEAQSLMTSHVRLLMFEAFVGYANEVIGDYDPDHSHHSSRG